LFTIRRHSAYTRRPWSRYKNSKAAASPPWARRIASASLIVLGDCKLVACFGDCETADPLGSLGLFRANGPITAHPHVRMHRIPPRVVLAVAGIAQHTNTRRQVLFPAGLPQMLP